MSKAEEYLDKEKGLGMENWDFQKFEVVELMEAYHQSRVNAISDDEKYCKYCGNKLTFIVETDINSGKECINDLCKNKLLKQ